MYEIVLTRRAIKDLKGIPQDVQVVLANKLRDLATDPTKYARKLSNPKIGTFRFRIGSYRMIFDIIDQNIVILNMGIGVITRYKMRIGYSND